jgi:Family of unknown function (DUF6152)
MGSDRNEARMKFSNLVTTFAIALMTLGGGVRLAAHHSHAMFDMTREVTLTGTINKVVFRNPHMMMYVDVKNPDGEIESWSVEMSTIDNELRRGLDKDTLKPGDKITVKLHPLRDGSKGGNYTSITTADGKTYD